MGYTPTLQTVVETLTFARQASGLLSKEEQDALIEFLANNPEAGDVIKSLLPRRALTDRG